MSDAIRLDGVVCTAYLASGHTFCLGKWWDTPYGTLEHVFWSTPDGRRILLAASERDRELFAQVYRFDESRVVPLEADYTPGRRFSFKVRQGDLDLSVEGSLGLDLVCHLLNFIVRLIPRFIRRRRKFTRFVNFFMPLAGWFLNLGPRPRVYGVNPTGVQEWRSFNRQFAIRRVKGILNGEDLGEVQREGHPVGWSFAEPVPYAVEYIAYLERDPIRL